jgi:glycosyltransferase involved in cell wall biosynthesis
MTKKRSVAFDFVGISSQYNGGASVFAKTFLSELVARPDLHIHIILNQTQKSSFEEILRPSPNVSIHGFESQNSNAYRGLHFIATRVMRSPRLLAYVQRYRWKNAIDFIERNCDSCLSLTTYISFPLKNTIHFATMHDIQERALPEFFSSKERKLRSTQVLNTLKNVTGLQVSSKFVRDEIVKYYPEESKDTLIKVIPEGFSSIEFPDIHKESRNYINDGIFKILFPANNWSHKGHVTFFQALEKISAGIPVHAVLTGGGFENTLEIQNRFEKHPFVKIHFKGFVKRAELLELYSQVDAVISCSMYESSSLPILEGATHGCALIASDIAAHQEMAEKLNISLFEVNNPHSLARTIETVIMDLSSGNVNLYERNRLKSRAFEWSKLFEYYFDFLAKPK